MLMWNDEVQIQYWPSPRSTSWRASFNVLPCSVVILKAIFSYARVAVSCIDNITDSESSKMNRSKWTYNVSLNKFLKSEHNTLTSCKWRISPWQEGTFCSKYCSLKFFIRSDRNFRNNFLCRLILINKIIL